MSSKANSKQSVPSSNYSFFKALVKSFKKSTSSASNNDKLPFVVTPMAVGGSENQPALINELKISDNHRKLEILLKLKESIKNHSISSILETWIPARQILYYIDNDANGYSKYIKLRKTVIELLYTCIQYDDLTQLSVTTRYFSDILLFCKVSQTAVDPNIESFLKCFYLLVDNKLIEEFHSLALYISRESSNDNTSLASIETGNTSKDIETMCQRSLIQFLIDILSCETLLETKHGLNIMRDFINKLNTILREDNCYIFDNKVLALAIKIMFKIALQIKDIEGSNLVINQIFNFINTALGYLFIPLSVFSRVLVLLFHFYSDDTKYSTIIEGIFKSLNKSDNCSQVTFNITCELIEQSDYSTFLNFDNISCDRDRLDVIPEDNELIYYKESFVKTISEMNSNGSEDTDFEIFSKKRKAKPLGLEKFFPLITKTINSNSEVVDVSKKIDPLEFGVRVFAGILKLIGNFISENNFELLKSQDKEFIFDPSSFKFQALVNSLYNRLQRVKLSENTFESRTSCPESKAEVEENLVDAIRNQESTQNMHLATVRSILFFIFFLLDHSIVFKNIPEDLFFYGLLDDDRHSAGSYSYSEKDCPVEDDLIISSVDGNQHETDSLEATCFSILDVLDAIYSVIFHDEVNFAKMYPNLFKDGKSYTENLNFMAKSVGENRIVEFLSKPEVLLFDVLHLYHQIIDTLQLCLLDDEYSTKLEPAYLSDFLIRKSDLLTIDNWKNLLKSYENGSRFLIDDSLVFADVMNSIVYRVLDNEQLISRRKMFQVDDPQLFFEVRLQMLKTIEKMLDFHFDFKGNNELLWPLVECLFGVNFTGESHSAPRTFFMTETHPDIIQFLIECLELVLLRLRHQYFEILLVKNILGSTLEQSETAKDEEHQKHQKHGMEHAELIGVPERFQEYSDCQGPLFKGIPLDTLIAITKLLVKLFVKTAVDRKIKHGALKASTIYLCLLSILRWSTTYLQANAYKENYLLGAEGLNMFFIVFIIVDCMTRIRASDSHALYFDNSKREYKILAEEQTQTRSKSIVPNEKYHNIIQQIKLALQNHLIFEYVDANLFLKPSETVTIFSDKNSRTYKKLRNEEKTYESSTIDFSEFIRVLMQSLSGNSGIAVTIFSWYSIVLQLSNIPLFDNSIDLIKQLRIKACEQAVTRSINGKSLSKEDKIILQKTIVRLLLRIVIYSKHFTKEEQDQIANVLVVGLDSFEKVGILCLHTLTVCCYQIPLSIKKFIQPILWKLQQHISNSEATPHILEFLLSLSHLPSLMSNFSNDDFKPVFAMAFKFIQTSNDQSEEGAKTADTAAASSQGIVVPAAFSDLKLMNYLSCLSYNVISSWFLKMKMKSRKQLAPFIIKSLLDISKQKGKEIDSRCVVLIDFVQRFTYSNLDLRFQLIREKLDYNDSSVIVSRWVFGISIISVITHKITGDSIITVRRPSGTTKFEVKPHQSILSLQNVAEYLKGDPTSSDSDGLFTSGFIFLQLLAHIFTDTDRTPLLIPNEQKFANSIALFDNIPLIEVYKAGLIYIAPGQLSEQEILLNSVGSREYQRFLSNIGNLIRLKDCRTFFTGGLDRNNDTDGEYAYCWDDKVSQLLFHTTTMMPSKNADSWIMKKRHVGNDFVNIFFDESGIPFDFDLIKSQFTFVNIVITPVSLKSSKYSSPYDDDATTAANISEPGYLMYYVGNENEGDEKDYNDNDDNDDDDDDAEEEESETFFRVKSYLRPDLPEVFSTCQTKTISSKNLTIFVRNLALNANQFAQIWHSDSIHITNWTHRYNELMKIKERVKKTYTDAKEEEILRNARANSNKQQLVASIPFLSAFNQPDKIIPEVNASDDANIKAKLFELLDFTAYS